MMTVDASAVLAIVLEEEDAPRFQQALEAREGSVMSSVNYWEVLVRARGVLGKPGTDFAEKLIASVAIEIVAPDAATARDAADAFRRYKGRAGGRLNMGDCFAYALAQREGDGLLFKGNDFPKTDVRSALRGDV